MGGRGRHRFSPLGMGVQLLPVVPARSRVDVEVGEFLLVKVGQRLKRVGGGGGRTGG